MWVSRAVKFSRAFINCIIGEIKKLSSQKQKTILSYDVRKDLVWWYTFMQTFNGIELIISNDISVNVASDACPQGFGSWCQEKNEYFSGMFPLNLQDPQIPIHVKEFWCVIISVKLWGENWLGKKVQIQCDNDAVCDVITYLNPKDPKMQCLLCEFYIGYALLNSSQ